MKGLLEYKISIMLLACILLSCEKEIEKGTVADNEGNIYKTVKIGGQWWMAENLKVITYNDDIDIPHVAGNAEWMTLSTAAYCWYNNDESSNRNTYGALYNWYAVSSGKICPTGWHIPNDSEWTTLISYLGSENVAGGKLKETGTSHWESPNTGATNVTEYNALPGGWRDVFTGGSFREIGIYSYLWSSTESNTEKAWYRAINCNSSNIVRQDFEKRSGFSIRCIKD